MVTSSRAEADCRLSAVPEIKGEAIEVSVVMPCLNEAETLEICIARARQAMSQANVTGEIVIADNGSNDGSAEIAGRMSARVVHVAAKGYGNALMGGIAAARGKYIVMGDADNSYDFGHIPRFVEQLRSGKDVVMGNRFKGGIEPGAMPFLHKHLGNPVLSAVGKFLFKSPVGDFHCGLRAFSKAAFERMDMRTTGMEFASEIVVKASLLGLSIAEVPTSLFPDGRSRPPHLRTWRDGWRHLRFLLLYSPRWLFLYPGLALMVLGAVLGIWLLPGSRTVGGVTFDVHTLVYAAAFVLLGFQSIAFACFTKIFAISEGLLPPDPALDKLFGYITLEVGLVGGAVMTAVGLAASIYAVGTWGTRHFGMLDYSRTMRIVIPAALFLMLGAQTIFVSFFLSVLGMRRK